MPRHTSLSSAPKNQPHTKQPGNQARPVLRWGECGRGRSNGIKPFRGNTNRSPAQPYDLSDEDICAPSDNVTRPFKHTCSNILRPSRMQL